MINENEDLSHVEYQMEETDTFVIGATSDPNPTKKKKGKTPKERGLAFPRYENILLVQSWLNTTLDAISGIEQKGSTYWEKIWKDYHERKEYVEPHPILSTHNVASLQYRWGSFMEKRTSMSVTTHKWPNGRSQSEMGVATHAAVAATLYQETEKRPFTFSHRWLLLDGKPKWQQIVADIKDGKKRNDVSSSHQSIGLDNDDDDVFVTNGKATVSKDNRLLVGTKWDKASITHDIATTKMSSTLTGIFSARESKKEERYKLMLDVRRKMMEWDRTRAKRRLGIEREKIELEKQEEAIKWELQKAQTFGEIELEKERLQLSRDANDAKNHARG
ncbi:glutathione s-transferase t3-like [Hordeum vulgare]|nr:glutathione s-transferase t3-like [Hordeum vulgare]